MNKAWIAAGVGMGLTCLVHVYLGGPELAAPLLRQDEAGVGLTYAVRQALYYCWHLVTLMLAAMAGMFLYAAFNPRARSLGVTATLLTLGAGVWNVILGLSAGLFPEPLVQWILFLPLALIGAIGCLKRVP